MKKEYTIIETKKLPHSEVEIKGSLSVEAIAHHRPHVLEHMKEHVNLPGFRKGKIPEAMLVAKIGELAIVEETAQHILEEIVPEIFKEQKTFYVDRPQISITKLVVGEPVEFTIVVAVMPEVKTPDYKKIAKTEMAKKADSKPVTDEDVNKVIEEIRKQMAGPAKPAKDGEPAVEPKLPEIDDAFLKSIGEFKDVADFKAKITENLTTERTNRAKELKRLKIAENLVNEAKIEIPLVFVEQELAIIEARFKDDIARMGISFPDYVKHINKTEDEIRTEWRPDAEKKVALELILADIARTEKIAPDQELLDKEVAHMIEHYPGADKERVTAYVTKNLIQDKVFNFLESQ